MSILSVGGGKERGGDPKVLTSRIPPTSLNYNTAIGNLVALHMFRDLPPTLPQSLNVKDRIIQIKKQPV